MKTLVCNNGVMIPAIGYGTYLATDGIGKQSIVDALTVGYRYFDTAAFYDNEDEIGRAWKQFGISRDELFISSKVWRTELGYDSTRKAFAQSLEKLQTDYLDLYLIHWPRDKEDDNWKETMQETWCAMEELYEEGKIRAIGLSNFLPHHIMALMETAKVKPMVNQLELHVGYMQEVAVAYCKEQGMVVQAWSPLGRRRLLEEPEVVKMAQRYGVSVSAFLLRFLLQQDIVIIPKTSNKERMKENLKVPEFTITPEDMSYLRCLPEIGWSGEHPDIG